MRSTLPWTAAFIILFGTVALGTDNPASDLERLQGKWVLVSGEFRGSPIPASKIDSIGTTVEIKGDKWTQWDKGDEKDPLRFVVKLDLSKDPKQIDLTDAETEAGEKPDSMLGIYSIDGDTLKFCVARPSMARPKQFKSDKDVLVWTYKRAKK